MKIQNRRQTKTFKWAALFMPADTASKVGPIIERNCDGAFGTLKFWLWVAISIAVALLIGQL